jgi:uncharacterized protein
MDVTPLIPVGRQIIQSYSGGRFKISGQHYDGAVIVLPDAVIEWQVAGSPEDFSLQSFIQAEKMAGELDVVLVGTGARMEFIGPGLRHALKQKGIAVDFMDTGAACRTYNVLMAEGRRVAALLLPVGEM